MTAAMVTGCGSSADTSASADAAEDTTADAEATEDTAADTASDAESDLAYVKGKRNSGSWYYRV